MLFYTQSLHPRPNTVNCAQEFSIRHAMLFAPALRNAIMQHYRYPHTVIQIFCKAPIAGQVKTRLQPQLSALQAAAVHEQLTQDTLAFVTADAYCPVQLWCSPTPEHAFFSDLVQQYPIELHTQCNGDLGQRMHFALSAGIAQFGSALVIGCDCPSLTAEHLMQALDALNTGNDAVIAPTEDGGYCLIGLKQAHPEVFDALPWSTPELMTLTRARMQSLQLNCVELPLQWDVDTYVDYLRYCALQQTIKPD